MSNDLIAMLRDWSDGPDTDELCREAADALTAQANSLGFLRQISEQQAYEITQQAATIAEQAAEIERLRGIVPELEWLTGCPECGMDAGCDCDSGTENAPEPAALEDIPACMFCGELIEPAATTVVETDPMEGTAHKELGPPRPLVYATPPRAALSDEQIRNLWFAAKPTEDGRSASWNFARAIEAAHNIGETK